MKHFLSFIFFSLLFFVSTQAQPYELRDWNRDVITKVNGRSAFKGARFTSIRQVSYEGANRAQGRIYAVNLSVQTEGIVSRNCSTPGCTPTSSRVVAGNQHELDALSLDAAFTLSDQTQMKANSKTQSDVLNAGKTTNMQKVNATNATVPASVNRAKVNAVRQ